MSENMSIKKAAITNFITRYSIIIIQLILNSILARLLTPDDYGIVAVVTVFTTFFTLIADMGIGPAIIQNKNLNDEDISSIFNFTIISGLLFFILFCFFSYPIALFYKNKVYIPLGILISVSILFNVVNIVPNAILLKEKKFKLIGIRTITITIICGIVTIVLAYLGFKYYAIVLNSILIAIMTFCFNLNSSKILIKKQINLKSINKIKHFSIYQSGFSIINYFSRNLDNLLIGKLLGEIQLGYYDKAYKLMLYPIQSLTHVITPILHPILSEYQNNRDYIYVKYTQILKLLSLIGIFLTMYCYFASEEIVIIMYGEQWIKSIHTFRILSLTIWVQMIMSSSGTIFQSLSETKYLFKAGYITTILNVSAIVIGLVLGRIEYIALMILISFSINFIITFYILVKVVLKKPLLSFLYTFIPEILIIFFILPFINFGGKIYINNIIIMAMYKFIIILIPFVFGLIITKQIKYFKVILKVR